MVFLLKKGNVWCVLDGQQRFSTLMIFLAALRDTLGRLDPIGGIWFDGMWDRPDANWRLDETYRLITREIVKPARNSPHGKNEVAWARAGEAAKATDVYVAMNSMTGTNESWFVWAYTSMANWEKPNHDAGANAALEAVNDRYAALDAELLNNISTMLVERRADLRYDSGRPVTACRFAGVARVVVKIGHGAEFAEARRIVKAASEKIKAPALLSVYQVRSGATQGTYLVMSCSPSMDEFDADTEGAAFVTAFGGAEAYTKLTNLRNGFQNSVDVQYFAFAPQMSSVPKAQGDADPYLEAQGDDEAGPVARSGPCALRGHAIFV